MTAPAPFPRRRAGVACSVAVGLTALAGCAPEGRTDAVPTASPSTSPRVSEVASAPPALGDPTTVVDGLTTPWSVTSSDGAILLSQRDTAEILEVVDDDTRVVGAIPGVAPGGEGGLLGIAVRDGFLYAYATTADDNRVVRAALEGEPGALRLGVTRTVIDGIPSANIHNGGRIAFGPDGMLYITAGDASDPRAAQDPDELGGKILRVLPDGSVPADNPFPGSPVWSLGHRNPQGIGWDAAGTMYASEFGQNTWDELNVIEPGANYGWPEVEGVGGREGFVDPVQQWAPAEASPSGLAVVDGAVVIANLRGQRVRVVPTADLSSSEEYLVGDYGRLRDVVAGPDGTVWVVTSNTDRGGAGTDALLRVPLISD
ncbi:PQQ-dependent sugar dehydrogenase [Microbacterium sp. KSW2-29]|uniref:PQQ-dependent sugar dehydrogenase n=1 Tax=Microbacterium phycohabitans TaxID=3075993 RepID=A0ABU3SKE5_9MICO|nr:PQQ-dependent sugar dehydrogenase [Microbacterium sp. KSW2-29]MDU0344850.1 PQQ-dependent sugar dehydrogenase [Microbacterium sp. KSW2-29]